MRGYPSLNEGMPVGVALVNYNTHRSSCCLPNCELLGGKQGHQRRHRPGTCQLYLALAPHSAASAFTRRNGALWLLSGLACSS